MRKVYGVAINDSLYHHRKGSVRNKFLDKWYSILSRCYSGKYPAYKDITVCEEWLTFSNFKQRMENQDWEGNVLDKDIINPFNKTYCPEMCIFVPGWINNLLLDSKNKRGNLPMGVTIFSGRGNLTRPYKARFQHRRRMIELGYFESKEKAHRAWQLRKADCLEEDLPELSLISEKVRLGVEKRIIRLRYHAENGIITSTIQGWDENVR